MEIKSRRGHLFDNRYARTWIGTCFYGYSPVCCGPSRGSYRARIKISDDQPHLTFSPDDRGAASDNDKQTQRGAT